MLDLGAASHYSEFEEALAPDCPTENALPADVPMVALIAVWMVETKQLDFAVGTVLIVEAVDILPDGRKVGKIRVVVVPGVREVGTGTHNPDLATAAVADMVASQIPFTN